MSARCPCRGPATRGRAAAVRRARFVTVEGLVLDVEGREDGTRRWIAITAAADPGAAPPAPAATPATVPAGMSGTPPAATPPALDPAAEAKRLSRRFAGREFEIPAFRFSALFNAESPDASTDASPAFLPDAPPGT